MPIRFGVPELALVLLIVILLFGVGRISKISGEIGSAIREFRKGIRPGEPEKDSQPEEDEQ